MRIGSPLALLLAVAWCGSARAQPTQQTHQTCVDVKVGTAQSYSCLNEQLGALARQQHRAAESESAAPYSATSPSNVTGQFNESATRNRLGANFGTSVTPERPH